MVGAAAWWTLTGLLGAFGIVGILTIGLPFLVVAGILTVVGLLRDGLRNRSMFALPIGVGVVPLYLAWLNRGGPGEVCHTTATTQSCMDAWSPWPFLAVGIGLIVLGSVLLACFGGIRAGTR